MQRILVANRGEIALRIIRTIREMGLTSIAIYSEVDREAPHVKQADEAVNVGPPKASESYLNIDIILEVCEKLDVDAIHPGYGFLSENPEFAQRVGDSKFTFIGPSAHPMKTMGNKLAAKEAVQEYDVPLVPGTDEPIEDPEKAKKVAKDIGFPVLIKAAAGGGGKGMRIVQKEGELEEQLERAISEAESSFGDGSVFVEKYIESPKHIEIQILGDEHDNYVHLFERECSVQRRHQKVIEEAPSPVVTPEVRQEMGEAAINVSRACDYTGAGTVEFIAEANKDGSINNFYFLEMNTRLQVEHPVTELVTGIDIVKEQIHIAQGKELSIEQDELEIKGHSIETRVYAEDPTNQFLPDIGKLQTYDPPSGHGVRVDDGMEEGMQIPIEYDPMIAKLITYGKDREEAIQRMVRAIEEYELTGVRNTLGFGKFVMEHSSFQDGTFNTHFVDEEFDPDQLEISEQDEAEIAAFMAARLFQKGEVRQDGTNRADGQPTTSHSPWRPTGWHLNRS